MSKAPQWFIEKLQAIDPSLFVEKDGPYWILCRKIKGQGLAPCEVDWLGTLDGKEAFRLRDCSIMQRTLAFEDGTPIPLGSVVLSMVRESKWNHEKYTSNQRALADIEASKHRDDHILARQKDFSKQEANSIRWAKAPKVGVT